MNKFALGLAVGALSIAALASAAKSGLKPGEGVAAFHPKHVVGPLANSTSCFPCTYKNAPQVQVFVNNDDMDNVVKIAKGLEAKVEANKGKGFRAMIIMVAPESKWASMSAKIKTMAKENKIDDLAISLLDPSNSALKDYKISLAADVKNTVLVYRNWKVEKNHVNLKGDEAGMKALNASVATILN
jgi:hypothetical protein